MNGTKPSTAPVRSQFADDPDFRGLLEEFAAALPDRRQRLIGAHHSEAYDDLRTRAHQLKGAGGGFGFPRLSELAAELEHSCISKDPIRIAAALEQVVAHMNRITV